MHRSIVSCSLITLLAFTPVIGAAQPADTTRISTEPLFTIKDAIVAGGFVAATVALRPMDRRVARRLQDSTVQAVTFARDVSEVVRFIGYPGSTYIGVGLYTVGRIGRWRRVADLGLHGTEAVLIGEHTVGLLKGVFGRQRPVVNIEDPGSWKLGRGFRQGDEYRSFPSGHAVAAFAAASAVTAETSRWWPESTWYVAPVMYGGATLVGLSRMYDNRHWASDVVMGAAIGTFAGLKVVKYHHSHPNNRIDRWLLSASVVPSPGGLTILLPTR